MSLDATKLIRSTKERQNEKRRIAKGLGYFTSTAGIAARRSNLERPPSLCMDRIGRAADQSKTHGILLFTHAPSMPFGRAQTSASCDCEDERVRFIHQFAVFESHCSSSWSSDLHFHATDRAGKSTFVHLVQFLPPSHGTFSKQRTTYQAKRSL